MVLFRRAAITVLGGAALLTLPAAPAGAGEPAANDPIVVTTTDDVLDPGDGAVSLREAVIQASEQDGDDEIELTSGEYVVDLGCDVEESSGLERPESGDLDHDGDGLSIVGVPTPGPPVIRAACVGGVHHRVLDHRSESLLDLDGVEFAQGSPDGGGGGAVRADGDVRVNASSFRANSAGSGPGGALLVGGDAVVVSSAFTANTAEFGGAVDVTGSTSILGGRFDENDADAVGGAVHGDDVTVDGSVFTANSAAVGGGAVYALRATVSDASIDHNTSGYGGGVAAGSIELHDSQVSDNVATEFGGGVFSGGTAQVERTAVSGNTAGVMGGGVEAEQVVLRDSVVRENTVGPDAENPGAVIGGGGMAGGYVLAERSTIADNRIQNVSGTAAGGGVRAYSLYMVESTVSDNTVAHGSGGGVAVFDDQDPDVNGGTFVSNSTISGNEVVDGHGGGISSEINGAIIQTTAMGNSAPESAAVALADDAALGADMLVIADSQGSTSCSGPVAGYITNSVDEDGSCTPADAPGVVRNVDAGMGPLLDNGGPTSTHVPESDSPAVDIVAESDISPTDQRGEPRPQGEGYDAGSVEGGRTPIDVTTTDDVIDADDGVVSLREAVMQADVRSGDDQVVLGAGSYPLTLGCDVVEDDTSDDRAEAKGEVGDLDHGDAGLVISGPGPDDRATIVACDGRRILQHTSEDDLLLQNLHLTGGTAADGGAVKSVGSVRVVGSRVDDNRAEYDTGESGRGGGVYTARDLTIDESALEGNSGYSGGGGFAGWQLTVRDSRFEGNAALSGGGAVYVAGNVPGTNEVPVVVRRSTFVGNRAGQGGALDAQTSSPANVIQDSVFRENWAGTLGGAVVAGDFRIEGTDFVRNQSLSSGSVVGDRLDIADSRFQANANWVPGEIDETGTVALDVSGHELILDSVAFEDGQLDPSGPDGVFAMALEGNAVSGRDVTIVGYPGGEDGGTAIRAGGGGVGLTNSTISGNGGRAVHASGPVVLDHSTVAENGAAGAASVVIDADADLTVRRSVIEPGVGGHGCDARATMFVDSIDADGSCSEPGSPGSLRNVDPRLGPLADNGGPTLTHLLGPSSPAVDLIPAARCVEHAENPSSTTDQRDRARPSGPGCDAGAVEMQPDEEEQIAFADVAVDHWAAEAISWVARRRVASGYSDGSFGPTGSITRAQAVTWLWHRVGRPGSAGHTFDDVADGFWAGNAIGWAAESGVVNGFRDGSFRPADPVTRVQFVRMLWQTAGYPEPQVAGPFVDTPAWAADAVAWAAENGIATGYSDNTFRPDRPVTRAAAARMLLQAAVSSGHPTA